MLDAESSALVSRVASNAMRQAIGAGLFFGFTFLLARALGNAGYAKYFVSWNLAQILVASVSFGLYNGTIRRLSRGEASHAVILSLIRPHIAQLLVIAVASVLLGLFAGYDGKLIFLVAAATTFGTLLTAISLGLDSFRVFAFGELLHNCVLLILVGIYMPRSPDTVGWLFIPAALAKAVYYGLTLHRSVYRSSVGQTGAITSDDVRSYAILAYGHSLLQIATFRGFVIASGYLVPIGGMAQLAVVWSFCDRSLTLVQGINQVLYPRLMRSSVSTALRFWINAGTSAAYLITVFVLTGGYWVLSEWGYARPMELDYPGLLLCVALLPHVVRLLKMTEALALSRFRALYMSHAMTIIAAAFVFAVVWRIRSFSFAGPPMLIFIASCVGLIAFYRRAAPTESAAGKLMIQLANKQISKKEC